MQNDKHFSHPSQQMGERMPPVSLMVLLMQEMTGMRHVDEVLSWLASAIVHHQDIPVVQFWSSQLNREGQPHAELRAASQKLPFSWPVVINRQVVFLIDRLRRAQRQLTSLPIERVFPPEQISLLMRYGLRFWSCSFLEYEDVLLPPGLVSGAEGVPSPLLMAISSFSHVSFSEKQERAVSFLLEQSIRLLRNHHLLISTGARPGESSSFPKLSAIVPRRSQSIKALRIKNSLASTGTMADKNALLLYSAVDGRKTLAELLQSGFFEGKEGFEALQYLLRQQKIQLYTLDGRLIEDAFL